MKWLLSCLAVGLPMTASAFCGFYVAGGGAELFNNATQVALMRSGTRTVLSMQNDYQGPPEDFALVIPVPVILQKENVRTLKKSLFSRLDTLTAPRLVEYWEQDPCPKWMDAEADGLALGGGRGVGFGSGTVGLGAGTLGRVRVEAQFDVGEYEVVILSAEDALGLEQWLLEKKYRIPDGAAPLFRPYIQQGMKFFVAKVNVAKVQFEKGRAVLSPLRFHYDSERFELPVRLGLINAKGPQDLIIHILAKKQRYEVANLPNATIPTNIDLVPSAKSEFGAFYASLFDRTQAKEKGTVVTEYAWDAMSCDPCPSPPLHDGELIELGLDVLEPQKDYVEPELTIANASALSPEQRQVLERQLQSVKQSLRNQFTRRPRGQEFVVTRLHARYTKDSLGEDLVFKAVGPIQGGREFMKGDTGLERGATAGPLNTFQARYAMRHPWTGPATCKNPQWGMWGGKPVKGEDSTGASELAGSATNTAFAKRGVALEKLIESPIDELGLTAKKAGAGLSSRAKKPRP